MEAVINKPKTNHRALMLVLGTVFMLIASLCFIFHISPQKMAAELSEFTKHHYFLSGFISLVIGMTFFKMYWNYPTNLNLLGPLKGKRILSPSGRRRINAIIKNVKRSLNPNLDNSESEFTNKRDLQHLTLLNQEVLKDSSDVKKRQGDLEVALNLGNLYKQKVIICFMDGVNNVRRHTLATVWHIDDENVCVKAGSVISIIPVKSIYKIEL